MQVAWTKPALEDLDQIQDYVAQDSPRAAYRLVADILSSVDTTLPNNPMAGRPGRIDATREWVVPQTRYIIAYRITSKIEVLAVVHGAREWPAYFG
ncbi:hypothetical protein ABAC460_04475 [Asticcacaulis sp. AC460]|uniref:type II toxin-antitoxin system RelE/ParE family toxin n=1 Tax=Asticcacaulis sp. AC460 TaxID=1282360 RepID=UPI0003C3BE9D|nr:type II toxin-antitoxin system RelE/ParE family toxin [Asticcacaulis sp. AC460]ESQ92148.1 hypothetical protein ABAC460_04475 [Asticcacaulis sp. AC460]